MRVHRKNQKLNLTQDNHKFCLIFVQNVELNKQKNLGNYSLYKTCDSLVRKYFIRKQYL